MGRRKKSAAKATQLTEHAFTKYPGLKKPLEVIGKQIKVPGDYWERPSGGALVEESEISYLCTIVEFDALHAFPGGTKCAAFQMIGILQIPTRTLLILPCRRGRLSTVKCTCLLRSTSRTDSKPNTVATGP